MPRYSLCETRTPCGTRYYVDSRRVSRQVFRDHKDAGSVDTMQTVGNARGEYRHYCEVTVSETMKKAFNLL